MTAPSEPVRPADEETVHDVAVAINDSSRRVGWSEALWYADAVVASEPWQRLVRERDEARAALARVEALARQWGEMRPAASPDTQWNEGWEAFKYGATGDLVFALRGDAEEASDGR